MKTFKDYENYGELRYLMSKKMSSSKSVIRTRVKHKSQSNFHISVNPMFVILFISIILYFGLMYISNQNKQQIPSQLGNLGKSIYSEVDDLKSTVTTTTNLSNEYIKVMNMANDNISDVSTEMIVNENLGKSEINMELTKEVTLARYALPNEYYGDIDFSSFQPFMDYTKVTNKSSPSYEVLYDEKCYTDEYGFRRYKVDEGAFSIDGQDDYVIALGNYYKDKGTVGERFLIVTSTGKYTAITGAEKDNVDTDKLNMFGIHGDKAGVIEWVVDSESGNMSEDIFTHGTVTEGPVEVIQGELLYIYKIL